MKSVIRAAGVFACLTTLGFSAEKIAGWSGPVTIALTSTEVDDKSVNETKSEANHDQLISLGANSTRVFSQKLKTTKITNKTVIDNMVEAKLLTDAKGYGLYIVSIEVDGEEESQLVAYKKGAKAVAVPSDEITLGDSVEVYSETVKDVYNAGSKKRTVTDKGTSVTYETGFSFGGFVLSGVSKESYSSTEVTDSSKNPSVTTYSESRSSTLNLSGGVDNVAIIEGKVTVTEKYSEDVSALIP